MYGMSGTSDRSDWYSDMEQRRCLYKIDNYAHRYTHGTLLIQTDYRAMHMGFSWRTYMQYTRTCCHIVEQCEPSRYLSRSLETWHCSSSKGGLCDQVACSTSAPLVSIHVGSDLAPTERWKHLKIPYWVSWRSWGGKRFAALNFLVVIESKKM